MSVRKFIRRLLMFHPGYRKAHFVGLEVQELRRELVGLLEGNEARVKAAVAAARPADRTDELKAEFRGDLSATSDNLAKHMNGVVSGLAATLSEKVEAVGAAVHGELAKQMETVTERELKAIKDSCETLFRNDIRCRWQVLDALDGLLFPPSMSVKCLVCGHEAPKSTYETRVSECIFGGGRLERFVCPECGCVFGPLKMMALGDSQLASEYSQHYHVYCEGDSRRKEIAAFHALNPQKGGRYLNFGAGAWSKSTIELRAEGWDVYDYEPHAPGGAQDWVLRSYDQLQAVKFDGVFSNDILEHFKDPVAALSRMKTILRDGGRMSHCTGCYEYAYEYTRFHYVFYTGKSVELLADRCGFRAELGSRLKEDEPAHICMFTVK